MSDRGTQNERFLRSFEDPHQEEHQEEIFHITVIVFIFATVLSFGLYLNSVKVVQKKIRYELKKVSTEFVFTEKKKIKKRIVKKVVKKEKPVDLTKKVELNKKEDDIVKKSVKKKKVRRIYGLKKIYSSGLGSGGDISDAVVGKIGNTINKDVDTVKATKEDIKGKVVSLTRITSAPRLKKSAKPEYTPEMRKNKVEGTIRVKILIDTDGKVKKAIVKNDIGYGAAERAKEACFKMLFEPAMMGQVPVATWIIMKITFKMLD